MSTAPINGGSPQYTVRVGDQIKTIPAQFEEAAAQIAGADHPDTFLSDADFERFFRNQEQGATGSGQAVDPQVIKDRANELKSSMAQTANPAISAYHNFQQLIAECDKVKDAHPDYVKKTSLGKTAEGRDLWMYTITKNANDDAATANKPGVVLIKNIHAREWATGETSPALMHTLLDNVGKDPAAQQRLQNGVVYLLACQNPDGREFSFNSDNMWRKNRSVQTDSQGKPTGDIGVDPNRNWGEPQPILNHSLIFDPLGTPGSGKLGPTLGQTSDDPSSELYRGKAPASEPEVATAEKVIVQPNVVGVNDCHSYSADVLAPWDHSKAAPPDQAIYQDVGNAMAHAASYKLEPGIGLYPNSGDTCIFGAANGKISFTTEIGQSFQPSASVLPKVIKEGVSADMAMVDKLFQKAKDGTLGPRTPVALPPADQSRSVAPQILTDSDPIQRYFID